MLKVLKDGGHAQSRKMKAVETFRKGLVNLISEWKNELINAVTKDEAYLCSPDALRVLSSIS